MRIPAVALAVLILSAAAHAGPKHYRLETHELSVEERLALPYLKVAVGPDHPLELLGRDGPFTFRETGGKLFAKTGIGTGPPTDREREIVPGERVLALVKEGAGCVGWVFVPLVFLKGNPEHGEPRWFVVSLQALHVTIGRRDLAFLDHDCDGRHLTPYRDIVVTGDDPPRAVAPLLCFRREVWKLTYKERDIGFRPDRSIYAEPLAIHREERLFPRWREVEEGLGYLNGIRADLGLPPLALSEEASRAAMLHVAYLEQNGGNGREESKDLPGYTAEGAEAGRRSIGYSGTGDVRNAIRTHLGSALSRLPLLDPRNTAIGIAASESRIWIHVDAGGRRAWEDQGPVIFPGPGRSWSSGAYSGEAPDPLPPGNWKAAGLPVTAAFFDAQGVTEVRATLMRGGRPTECWKTDADVRQIETSQDPVGACIVTRRLLACGAHRLRLTWRQDGRPCRMECEFYVRRSGGLR